MEDTFIFILISIFVVVYLFGGTLKMVLHVMLDAYK